jgi:hypothetical protein
MTALYTSSYFHTWFCYAKPPPEWVISFVVNEYPCFEPKRILKVERSTSKEASTTENERYRTFANFAPFYDNASITLSVVNRRILFV